MNQNASKLIMLLLPFLFFMASCSSSSRTYNESSRSNTSRKSVERGPRKELRKDIAQHSRKYKGIKYKYAGKSPKTGFDCSGFTSYVLKKFNIEIDRKSVV